MTEGTGYTLTLSEAEVGRYRTMAAIAHETEADLWRLAGIVAGAAVGDIGCGPGAMLPAVSDQVGTTGRVVAVDGDPAAVAAAQALVTTAELGNVTVHRGNADATGIEPGSLDTAMMRHVLAHNGPTEQQIVDHLATLIRPGGCVYLVDVTYEGMAIRPEIPDLTDMNQKYAQFHAQRGNDLLVGRRLDLLLRNAGLEVEEYRGRFVMLTPPPGLRPPPWAARESMIAAGVATPEDVARWDAALTAAEADPPTLFLPNFAAVGRKPA